MGSPAPAPSTRRHSTVLAVAGGLVGVALTLVLARYAIDVLFFLVGLAVLGLLLHLLGTWLAESDLLSPGWFTIVVLGAALAAWAFLVPAEGLSGLGRYVPKPVADAFEAMESRGWAGRALVGPGGGGPAPANTLGGGAGTPSGRRPIVTTRSDGAATARSGTPSSATLTLTASRPTTTLGEAVVFTARLTPGTSVRAGSVSFYDGSLLLGSADLRREGGGLIAYLSVAGLAVGTHEIRAQAGGDSSSVRHRVLAR